MITNLKFINFSRTIGETMPPNLEATEHIAMPLDLKHVGKISLVTQYIIQKTEVKQYLVIINNTLQKKVSFTINNDITKLVEPPTRNSEIVCFLPKVLELAK